ncbi:MAG: S8 family serine peptidase [Betaproteobacteria bacterium]|nr:S8 family serine peptidase [Betaproteobacteria bacterium]
MIMENVAMGSAPIALPAIDPAHIDARSLLAPPGPLDDGRGVRVGVLDTGCGAHADLVVAKGISMVYGDSDSGYHDTEGHGTHVAGVVAARGREFRGLAPSVSLNIYRVFPRDGSGASNFDIGNAIDTAVADGCDLLNLSLGGGPMDAVTDEAIKSARARGTVCVIAAGNDAGPVSNPGTHPLALCVSAIGAKGTWPKGATQQEDVTSPSGRSKTYMAAFSNTGPEVDLAGTGCGIISTYPGDRFAVMDGTSMACPCVTGAIARLLSGSTAILNGARDAQRADQIVRLATQGAVDLGFARESQGAGLRS